jgi:hypothetical protein
LLTVRLILAIVAGALTTAEASIRLPGLASARELFNRPTVDGLPGWP